MSSTASSGEVKNAKSLLFVPANRPDRFAKALESEASAIIIDLEDAVAEDCKDSARAQLVTYLPLLNADQLMRTAVRVNAVDSRFHADDISALREWAACGVTLMLPKSESAVAIAQVASNWVRKDRSWRLSSRWPVWTHWTCWHAHHRSYVWPLGT